MTNEAKLVEALRAIELELAGPPEHGAPQTSDSTRLRIMARLSDAERREAAAECRMSATDPWSQRLLLALFSRYGLKPYRYRRQRLSAINVKLPPTFAQEILVPAFNQSLEVLHEHLTTVTDRVVAQALNSEIEAPAVVDADPPAASTAFGG